MAYSTDMIWNPVRLRCADGKIEEFSVFPIDKIG